MSKIYDIYDRAAKRCLSLSKRGTIMLINGLYEKDYPLDSPVDYHWTEHEDEDLRKTLADTIITINHTDSYHMEIQMYPDEEIVLRVFEYGYHHALVNRDGRDTLIFPNPKIVYLYEDGGAPEYQELLIDFGEQGSFRYRVSTCRYLSMSREELQKRQMIVLIPFQLLRLRKEIEKRRTLENQERLKELIQYDIIGAIQENVAAGNITALEGRKLKQITLQLYRHIYKKYEELEESGVNEMIEEAMILDIDIIEMEHKKELRKLEKEKNEEIKEKEERIKEEMMVIAEQNEAIRELSEKLKSLGISEEEIARMSKQKQREEE